MGVIEDPWGGALALLLIGLFSIYGLMLLTETGFGLVALIIGLATLTGAMIIALGHEMAGVFSNDAALAGAFLKAAGAEGEGAWRMPLGPAYDKMLKSQVADMKNVGGRPAGSITAAQFLQRFVTDDTPWIHLDIAGTSWPSVAPPYRAPGPTGITVRTLAELALTMSPH